MPNIAEVRFDSGDLPLEETLSQVAEARFEVKSIATDENNRIRVLTWVTANDISLIDAALAADATVADPEVIFDHRNMRLYRMSWISSTQVLQNVLSEINTSVLDLTGVSQVWKSHILFPDRDALSAVYSLCRGQDLRFDVVGLYEQTEATHRGHYGLTEIQKQTLIEAAEIGYFDIPRSVTMGELAENLGVTRQAVSERLRRGHVQLIETALVLGHTDCDPTQFSS